MLKRRILPHMNEIVLSVKGLRTYFDTDEGLVRAVDDISFDIRKGEIFSLVGESGCGKSMTAFHCFALFRLRGVLSQAK